MTQSKVDEIRHEYETWDPKVESSHELARRLGIGRTTLYELRRKGWRVMGSTRAVNTGNDEHDLAPTVRLLTDELLAAKTRIAELEAELARRDTATE
jgi:hypothetical protein